MSSITAFLSAIPEILRLIKAMHKQMDLRGETDRKKTKEKLDKMAEAIEENDEKKLNDVFNSL